MVILAIQSVILIFVTIFLVIGLIDILALKRNKEGKDVLIIVLILLFMIQITPTMYNLITAIFNGVI